MRAAIIIAAAAAMSLAAPLAAQTPSTPPPAASTYAPYNWLIGDWSSNTGIRELITYGPRQSYIHFSVFTPDADGTEHLHFEGIAMWNAKSKVLDYLFAVEPGSGVQENGTIRAEADGSIVREVELIDTKGKAGTFRQTFRQTGANSAVTTVMRQTPAGWVPTFPGSDNVVLTRR
jgi:hypothetical protein